MQMLEKCQNDAAHQIKKKLKIPQVMVQVLSRAQCFQFLFNQAIFHS